jgi:import inner membrane translocase subunit TIM13
LQVFKTFLAMDASKEAQIRQQVRINTIPTIAMIATIATASPQSRLRGGITAVAGSREGERLDLGPTPSLEWPGSALCGLWSLVFGLQSALFDLRPAQPITSSPCSTERLADHRRVLLARQIQHEMNAAFVQEFYQTVRDKCFKACVTKPGTSLTSSEQQCLAKCCDRYQEATEIVTKSTLEMSGYGE